MRKSLVSDKKGIFYLLLSSIFIMVMIVVFLTYKEYSYTDQQKVTETRITTINDFIKSIDTDSSRVIFISGFRSLIAIEDYVARTAHYLNGTDDTQNLENFFRCAFYYGTNVTNVAGNNIPGTNCTNSTPVDVLANATYSNYLDKLRAIAGMIGLDINITLTNITGPNTTGINLYQTNPWQVVVNVTVHITIADRNLSIYDPKISLARWDFNKTYSANVSIISLRDPIYSVETKGKMPNAINISSITDITNGFVGAGNDTTNLSIHLNNSYYVHNNQSPSFLMRLKGDFSNSSCCGIESFVYIPRLSDQGFTINTSRSIIDYIYFSGDVNITEYGNKTVTEYYNKTACNVKNMPNWFVIDAKHMRPLGSGQPDYIRYLNYTDCP